MYNGCWKRPVLFWSFCHEKVKMGKKIWFGFQSFCSFLREFSCFRSDLRRFRWTHESLFEEPSWCHAVAELHSSIKAYLRVAQRLQQRCLSRSSVRCGCGCRVAVVGFFCKSRRRIQATLTPRWASEGRLAALSLCAADAQSSAEAAAGRSGSGRNILAPEPPGDSFPSLSPLQPSSAPCDWQLCSAFIIASQKPHFKTYLPFFFSVRLMKEGGCGRGEQKGREKLPRWKS